MEANQKVSPATIQQYLGGLNYPASKEQMIRHAQGQSAPQEVIDMLNELPDQGYSSPVEVVKQIGNKE